MWAGEHARAFQRASSRLKVANGYLSQMQHNHRGLPMVATRYGQGCTTLACRASDGTTPSRTVFQAEFLISLRACYRRSMRCPAPATPSGPRGK